MIRALAHQKNGRTLLLLGVDRENIRRLTSGQPIHVAGDGHGMDLEVDVFIVYGDTLQDVVNELKAAGIELPTPAGDPA